MAVPLVIRTTGIEDFIGDTNQRLYLKALIMGPPSAGKTRSASYWPRPIFADCEKGRMSIADRKMPYAEITTSAQMEALIQRLRIECQKPYDERQFQTFVLDTVDSYQRIIVQERLTAERKAAMSGWADWGFLDQKMTNLLASLLALPMNIVCNLHVKDIKVGDEDDGSAMVLTGPKLKGDIRDQIAAEFDYVGYMGTYWEAEDGERVLKRGVRWHPEPTKPILKDRGGQLPEWTRVQFTDDDYWGIYNPLIQHLDDLGESETLQQIETEVNAPQVVKPHAGGPVANPPAAPKPSKTAPPKAAAKAAPPKASAASAPPPPAASSSPSSPSAPAANGRSQAAPPPPAARLATNVPPAAPRSAPDLTPSDDAAAESQAAAAAQPPAEPQAEPTPEPADTGADAAPQEPVTEGEPEPGQATQEAAEHVATSPDPLAVAQESLGGEVISDTTAADEQASSDGDNTTGEGMACGSPTDTDEAPPNIDPWPVPGCGKFLHLTSNGGEDPAEIVEIARIRTRTNLCAADFGTYRKAQQQRAATVS